MGTGNRNSVSFVNPANDLAGISYGDRSGGDILGHHTAGTDDCSVADGHSRQYDYVGGNPYVVSYRDGHGAHDTCIALVGMERMVDGAEGGVGTDENVVTDGHLRFVEDGKVEIAYEVLSDVYVRTEVAMERRVQYKLFADAAKKLFGNLSSFLPAGGRKCIQPEAAFLTCRQCFEDAFGVSVHPNSRTHPGEVGIAGFLIRWFHIDWGN